LWLHLDAQNLKGIQLRGGFASWPPTGVSAPGPPLGVRRQTLCARRGIQPLPRPLADQGRLCMQAPTHSIFTGQMLFLTSKQLYLSADGNTKYQCCDRHWDTLTIQSPSKWTFERCFTISSCHTSAVWGRKKSGNTTFPFGHTCVKTRMQFGKQNSYDICKYYNYY